MKIRHILSVVCCIAVAYSLVRYLTREQPVSVTITTVGKGTVEATVANTRAGTVKARHRARLAPSTGGQIATLDVRTGDVVKAGQQLLSLWNEDLRAQLQLTREETAAAQASARETCLMAEHAAREARRLSDLRQKKSTSESAYDLAVTTAKAQQIACETAGIKIRAGQAKTAAIEAQLERTILVAPFAGIIAEVNGEIGEFITPSPTGVATLPAIDLINLDELYVTAPIDEIDAAQIKPGMTARISLDAFPDKVFTGKVVRISPYVLETAKQARTVEVECDFSGQDRPENLLAGYSADVEILLAARDGVLRIPSEALLEDKSVYLVDQGAGRVHKRTVDTGLSNWRYSEAVAGLTEGDQLVSSLGREGLRDNVSILVEDKAAATTP